MTANILKGGTTQKGGARQRKVPHPIQTRGITAHTTPAIQHGYNTNRRGTPTHRRGRQQHYRPSTQCHPTIHNATPPSTAVRGGEHTRIPHHTNSTHTHSPPHTT
nr:MAG TPA: hypothetical protein [Caudoviricetes sp.]